MLFRSVMRKLFISENQFNKIYSANQQTIVREIDWRDFAEVSALFCEPAKMYSFDFCGQIFSTRYAEVNKFLLVFPFIMNRLDRNGVVEGKIVDLYMFCDIT